MQKIKQQNSSSQNQQKAPKNIIIEYERPKAIAVRQVVEEGIFRVDPATYTNSLNSNSEIRVVDRITDLPIENSTLLQQHFSKLKAVALKSAEENLDQEYSDILSKSLGNSENNSGRSSTNSNYNNNNNNQSKVNLKHLQSYYSFLAPPEDSNIEYETITTSVSEELAMKIIEEAKAAGVLSRYCN